MVRKKKIDNLEKELEEVTTSPLILPFDECGKDTVSTGSTLLDLSISGGRVRGGGIPSGILVEIFGPSGYGKTAILSEIIASIQINGGKTKIKDPEGRIDKAYARIYGVEINKENYSQPDTVVEVFEDIRRGWPDDENNNFNIINGIGVDSLAALSTEMEMEKGDKMGMRRAKDFSQELRRTCRLIKQKNWLVVCTNQLRQGDSGEFTPGGKGIGYYSSLRIKVVPPFKNKYVDKQATIEGITHKKIRGIKSICYIKKSSIDDPYREAPIYIMFGHGIDDIRGNLQYLKDMTKATKYDCITSEWAHIDKAIEHIEVNNLEAELREKVIDMWTKIETTFKVARKPKVRF